MLKLSQNIRSKLLVKQQNWQPVKEYFNNSELLEFCETVSGVDYIWSRDPKKLTTYRRIITQFYAEELGVQTRYDEIFSEVDFRSLFFLIMPKNDYAGGCRITISNPYMNFSLPCESEDFKIRDEFPEIDFDNYLVSEVTRFSLRKEFRNSGEIYTQFFKMYRDLMTAKKVRYMLIRSSVYHQKLYYRYARKFFNLVLQKDFCRNDENNLEYHFCIYENPDFRK